ncbi:DUF6786 family protein [Flavitalea sp.]|nr:DUF6786 family protein [Flavitalea sp.]
MNARLFLLPVFFLSIACNDADKSQTTSSESDSSESKLTKGSYAYDADFLKKNTAKTLELKDAGGNARVLLSADYQGRVMTSTAKGNTGTSYGWLNYTLIASSEKKKQFNPVGGEERFWLGPEGGQYSIYFKGKDSFAFGNWQVPAIIDTVTYDVVNADAQSATFRKTASVTNYSGTVFNIEISRIINLLSPEAIAGELNTNIDPSLATVAYTTENSIKNTGSAAWKKESGLLSIWLLAMLTPSDQTKVIIPFEPGKNAAKLITRDYFGAIPPERLIITDSFLVLNCDGKFRSKVGISPVIARPIAGSYDFEKNILTITKFTVDKNGSYVNSKWELQQNPYKGDAVNAYNDGPLADGTQMGPFYEIESSSPAKELNPGETQVYKQSTFHFEGDFAKLETLAQQILGVKLSEIKSGIKTK